MLDELSSSFSLIAEQTIQNLPILFVILWIIWSVFFISLLIRPLLLLGIFPRKIYGLPGIILSPLLHADFNHIFFNSIPLFVLSNFLLIQGLDFYLHVTLIITLLSGILIWCFARPGLHIGASAVITGYWGFLVFNIYQQGTLTSIILGLISLYYFAGIFMGIFPMKRGVSWEGHLFGLIAGFITNWVYTSPLII